MGKGKLNKYIEKAELLEKLEKLYPEYIREIEEKTIKNYEASWEEEGKKKIIKDEKKRIITIEKKINPKLIELIRINDAKIYFNLDEYDYHLYIFDKKRNYITRIIKIEEHDIVNMLAFCLAEMYGENLLKQKDPQIRISKKLRSKIKGILEILSVKEKYVL